MNKQGPWEPNRLLQNSPHSGPTTVMVFTAWVVHLFTQRSVLNTLWIQYYSEILNAAAREIILNMCKCVFCSVLKCCHSTQEKPESPNDRRGTSLAPTADPMQTLATLTSSLFHEISGILSWLESSSPMHL